MSKTRRDIRSSFGAPVKGVFVMVLAAICFIIVLWVVIILTRVLLG